MWPVLQLFLGRCYRWSTFILHTFFYRQKNNQELHSNFKAFFGSKHVEVFLFEIWLFFLNQVDFEINLNKNWRNPNIRNPQKTPHPSYADCECGRWVPLLRDPPLKETCRLQQLKFYNRNSGVFHCFSNLRKYSKMVHQKICTAVGHQKFVFCLL